jgi:hypothetical protein
MWRCPKGVLTFVQVAAIVVCFDAAGRVGGVGVEGVQVCAYVFDWPEVLNIQSATLV